MRPTFAVLLPVLLLVSSAPHASKRSSVGPEHFSAPDTLRVVPNDGRAAAGTLVDRSLELQLVARPANWKPEGDSGRAVQVAAFAEEGGAPRIPGPMIRVPVGTAMHIRIRNALADSLRVYGLQSRPALALDSLVLASGASTEVRFVASSPGSYLYWARTTRDTFPFGLTGDSQLYGAIIVDSLVDRAARSADDRVLVLGLWSQRSMPGVSVEKRRETLVFNGLAWPHTERIHATVGDTLQWRVLNATRRPHPMHLHGFYFRVNARGTLMRDTIYTPPQQRLAVTERLAPGMSMSISWSPRTPGNWLFHCHFIEHIAGRIDSVDRTSEMRAHANHAIAGMSGLVLGIIVRPKAGAVVQAGADPVRRHLRLFVTERARAFGEHDALSFVLQEGHAEPARDSMRVPGSPILLVRHEPVAITVLNRASVPVSVHWHGIELESYYDGVSGWSGAGTRVAPPVAPGDSFVVRLTPDRAGTFIYHTHQDEVHQLGAGLYGPLLVLERGVVNDTIRDHILLLGSSGPAADAAPNVNGDTLARPIRLRTGLRHRLRFISIAANDSKIVRLLRDGAMAEWTTLAKDGAELPAHQHVRRRAQLTMGAGETWDVELEPSGPDTLTLEITTTGRVGLPPVTTRLPVVVR